ncbi:MAG: cation:proton antiporter [Acidimicrobiales bacterium]
MTENQIIIGLTAIVVLGVGAQWIGRRLGFPALLLLLPAGLVAGATGVVKPEELFGETLFPLVTLLVALLLFQSGLNLRLVELPRPARGPVLRLVTAGLMITFAGAWAALVLATDMPTDVAAVLGAILVVSGPTVVGPLLRVIRPRPPMGAVLAWEGTVLDPLGATLGVVVLNLVLAAGRGGIHPVFQMLGRLGLGVTVGLLGAAGLVFVLSRFLVTDDMEAAVAVLVAVLCFGLAEVLLSEAGLFAAVTLGVVAANQRVVPTARINGFGETLEVLIIGILFVLLGALVDVSALVDELPGIIVVVALLVVVVRPAAVAVSLARSRLTRRDRALAGWMDPRGVVAAATAAQFAVTLDNAGFDSSLVSPIAFGVILGTGLVYGLTAAPVARALRVAAPRPVGVALVGTQPWVIELARCLQDLGATVLVLSGERPEQLAERHRSVPMVSLLESEEELSETLATAPLDRALVATEPQALVTLVVAELVEHLGRSHVYVVPLHGEGSVRRALFEAWTPQPFAADVSLDRIRSRLAAGAEVRVCPEGISDGAIPLAAVRPDGSVDLRPGLARRAPTGTVVALVGGVDEPARP